MTKARNIANILSSGTTLPNFSSTGIDDNADANAVTIDSAEKVGIGSRLTWTQSQVLKNSIKSSLRPKLNISV